MTVLRSGSATHVGRVRAVNEDRSLESSTLFAVADGMGGHAGGEVAARTAIDTLERGFSREQSAEGLVDAVHEANHAVLERGRSDPSLRGMGTTLVATGLVPTDEGDRLVVVNVGDSRAYKLHQGELSQLSVDHSVAEALVARGELSEEEAQFHPHRHILTRALGVDPDVEVDVWELVPEQGDRFLLCSDGLTNEVEFDEIRRVLAETIDPKDAAEELVQLANAGGGNDNITTVVLDVLVGQPPSPNGLSAGAGLAAPTVGGGPGTGPAAAGAGSAGAPAGGAVEIRGDSWSATGTALMGRSEEARPEQGEKVAATRQPPLRRRVPRLVTLRALIFVVLLGGVVYAGWYLVHWYVDNSYFVGVKDGKVVIFQGRRGGFLGIDPKVVATSDIIEAQVPSYLQPDLNSGVEEPSRSAANNYVCNMGNLVGNVGSPLPGVRCPTPSSGSPGTTVPRSATSSTLAMVIQMGPRENLPTGTSVAAIRTREAA